MKIMCVKLINLCLKIPFLYTVFVTIYLHFKRCFFKSRYEFESILCCLELVEVATNSIKLSRDSFEMHFNKYLQKGAGSKATKYCAHQK